MNTALDLSTDVMTPVISEMETTSINGTMAVPEALDVDAYILARLGPKTMPLNWLIPMTTVYAIIFLTGIVGNVCTCIVISRNQYMQTATNCYLFNLAIADMLTLLLGGVPVVLKPIIYRILSVTNLTSLESLFASNATFVLSII
ncbi:g_PROTEIN_RECEP_F1_2 domain-containing protein [Trichonephila inaurata madagascariensis]|uniref:G_PROTEIN_RECEP_F1_2 domain-containing protein n=1 Tax=Trichonephila inaurata madagascariensis TaxID=2747483 RepID=A0A8X6XVD3_9ARAC|nr:g_PROTEIN_RECEP_F1_2 domain-containing protein [Trichonephila inaurata madagascariensis]